MSPSAPPLSPHPQPDPTLALLFPTSPAQPSPADSLDWSYLDLCPDETNTSCVTAPPPHSPLDAALLFPALDLAPLPTAHTATSSSSVYPAAGPPPAAAHAPPPLPPIRASSSFASLVLSITDPAAACAARPTPSLSPMSSATAPTPPPPGRSKPRRPPPRAQLTKQRRKYSDPRSSKYCHLCARHERAVEMVPCGNLARGLCQKSVCRKCLAAYALDWDAARVGGSPPPPSAGRPAWLCPHCNGTCPKRAKCFAYDRQTVRRRVKTQEARMTATGGADVGAAAR